jgi:SNF2 family DNA or RNA helicase
MDATLMRPRSDLHPYQLTAIDFLKADDARQLIAVMGSGKTTVALHAIADLKAAGELDAPALVVAPLLIAETVWAAEAGLWQDTTRLKIELVLGTAKRRHAAVDRPADLYVINYDNLKWLGEEVVRRQLTFSVLIADESSKLKNPGARRTEIMLALGGLAKRRWTLTGTPRGHQLTDVWSPAQFVTRGTAFPPFYPWRTANFFTNDIYERHWYPRAGVEAAVTTRLKPFTHVVDQAALDTRPPVVEIIHDVPLDPKSAAIYQALDEGGTTDAVAAKVAAGLLPGSEMAVVTKLMQVCSGASYDGAGKWQRLHDRRLDMLAEIHAGHDRPALVFVNFRHEIERIREKFPNAYELRSGNIDVWNAGDIEMLVAHPASAGHGVNLQPGSDTLVWFSLPWSAELFAQANARLVRQGQRNTINIHVLLSRGRIDESAHRVVHRRIADQDRLIAALQLTG